MPPTTHFIRNSLTKSASKFEKNSKKNQHYPLLNVEEYLNEKDTTEYTGIESYVADRLRDNDITWFPTNK